jgi:ribosomal protein S27AE
MTDQTMHVIPPAEIPRSSSIIHAPPKGKMAFSGDGPDRLLCGECGQPLAEGVREGQMVGVFIECPECGAMNDLQSQG